MSAASSDAGEPTIVKTEADEDRPPIHEPVGFILTWATFAAPAAWALQLVVNYAFSAHACFPSNVQLATPVWDWIWWLLIGVDCIAILASLSAGWAAISKWFFYRDVELANVGARRNRHLALWGMLTSGLFFIAIVFTIVMVFIEPTCNFGP
jgi:hypothetical protein